MYMLYFINCISRIYQRIRYSVLTLEQDLLFDSVNRLIHDSDSLVHMTYPGSHAPSTGVTQ